MRQGLLPIRSRRRMRDSRKPGLVKVPDPSSRCHQRSRVPAEVADGEGRFHEITKRTQLLRCNIRSIRWRGEDIDDLAFVLIREPAGLAGKGAAAGSG